MKRSVAIAVLWCLAASSAQASLLFEDNFDADALANGTVINVPELLQWTIDQGSVDLLVSGDFDVTCFGGAGGCVDLDGTTRDAGRMISREIFSIVAGSSYHLFAGHSGTGRVGIGGTIEEFIVQLVDAVTLVAIEESRITDIAPDQGFVDGEIVFTPGASFNARIALVGVGGDNFGPIIDNVKFCTNGACGAQAIDTPSAALLLLLGLASFRFSHRARA